MKNDRPTIKKCSGLVFRASSFALEMYPVKEGHGDCETCTYDPINNPRCSGYRPITVFAFKVKPANDYQI